MRKVECFKIRVIANDNPIDIKRGHVVKYISFDSYIALHEPTIIVADPFLYVKNETLYLFYEQKKLYSNGVIMMTSTKDLKRWTEPIVVLQDKCHLSYPYVFDDCGVTYMIPETCGLNSIRLYKANNDMTKFEFVKEIIKDNVSHIDGFSFSDTSVYKKDETYYLMTSIRDNDVNILKLYTSTSLMGVYTEHPKSPICRTNKIGRNGGGIKEYKNRLYRFAQDCMFSYGDNIHLIEINDISTTNYDEVLKKENILPIEMDFYKYGGHHINFLRFKEKYIIATDAKEYHYFFLNRFWHKIIHRNK